MSDPLAIHLSLGTCDHNGSEAAREALYGVLQGAWLTVKEIVKHGSNTTIMYPPKTGKRFLPAPNIPKPFFVTKYPHQ